ncbi:MAG: TIGR02757 family protein [Dissulfurimicrobium sp.]|uniref:TIGR02757 family protein n=1 Tax=Dissulfurimicrobium TaxID=1769732 RepID=UPI001EDC3DB4|nr:TIGR02757 family protein [Dissulfurimicrobium hydrothermale]UKL13499.1 TIGR02757 family protein [Dissulfurimicrobium hydrothermale]
MDPTALKERLEDLYTRFNRRELVHPDPLEFLYNYPEPMDREIAGLIASSLAYGRVGQILKSVSIVLNKLGDLHKSLLKLSRSELFDMFDGFRHRFTGGQEIAALLFGVKKVIEDNGSLERYLMSFINPLDDTISPALSKFIRGICAASGVKSMYLLPDPAMGSACKRPFLFLRWMVRCDQVDPGGWHGIQPSMLLVPVDTHMFKIAKHLGFTIRNQADLKTAVEITNKFKKINPSDPARYDFVLTRFGIRPEMDRSILISELKKQRARTPKDHFDC